MKKLIPLLLAAFCLPQLVWVGTTIAALDYPRPAGPVGDYAKVIPPEYAQRIAAASTELWQKTGAAVVVATVPSLGDESIGHNLKIRYCSQYRIPKTLDIGACSFL